MKKFADITQDRFSKEGLHNGPVLSLSKTDRYVVYKVGPVLSVNVSACLKSFTFRAQYI